MGREEGRGTRDEGRKSDELYKSMKPSLKSFNLQLSSFNQLETRNSETRNSELRTSVTSHTHILPIPLLLCTRRCRFLSAALAFEVVGFAEGLQGVVIEEPAQEAEGDERHDEDEQEFFEGHGRFGLPAQVEVALRIDFLKELVFQVFDEVDGFAVDFISGPSSLLTSRNFSKEKTGTLIAYPPVLG